jgi:hypothetical protein
LVANGVGRASKHTEDSTTVERAVGEPNATAPAYMQWCANTIFHRAVDSNRLECRSPMYLRGREGGGGKVQSQPARDTVSHMEKDYKGREC